MSAWEPKHLPDMAQAGGLRPWFVVRNYESLRARQFLLTGGKHRRRMRAFASEAAAARAAQAANASGVDWQ